MHTPIVFLVAALVPEASYCLPSTHPLHHHCSSNNNDIETSVAVLNTAASVPEEGIVTNNDLFKYPIQRLFKSYVLFRLHNADTAAHADTHGEALELTL